MHAATSFGHSVKQLRMELDLTQEMLAERVGCAVQTIRKIEAGERRPSQLMAERLAQALEVPPDERATFLKAARSSRVDRSGTEVSTNLDHSPCAEGSNPLLTTKLHIPPARPDLVPRPRLLGRLGAGLRHKLTLLSAPAGFGKTTLLSTALREHGLPVAWVSLDSGDNDAARFWAYIIAALNTLHVRVPHPSDARHGSLISDEVLLMLRSPQPASMEAALTLLVNALMGLPHDVTLVLDDYHVIGTPAIHQALTFLLDHLPPHLHLVLASRADPPLPLARLRARGELTELRTADLRFTYDEVADFLNHVMDLALAPDAIATLGARTEGWIAGLQLAALSLQGRHDVSGFMAALTGSHRYILDYLVEEVLEQQAEEVQRFLLETSILDRLSAPLCEAVTRSHAEPPADTPPGVSDGRRMLRRLEQANLFVIPLDDERRWYRYHHLFATLLRSRLREAHPERVAELHRRAAAWYERHGFVAEAVGHALAGRDWESALRLIEQTAEALVLRGEGTTLLGWLAMIPADLVRTQPRLGLASAWALVFTNQLDLAERRLQEVEGALGSAAATPDTQRMRAEVVAVRAAIASQQRDVGRTIALSREALGRLSEDSPHRGVLALNLGYAYGERGDVVAAGHAFADAAAISRKRSNLLVAMIGLTNVGQLAMVQGRLHRAAEVYRQALQLAAEHGAQTLPLTGLADLGIGALLCEWNELQAAERHLLQGIERTKQLGSAIVDVSAGIRLARLKQAQGDIEGALDMVGQVERSVPSSRPSLGAQLAAYRARLWLQQGNVAAAARWAQEHAVRPDDEPAYHREGEHLVLARLLIMQCKHGQAIELLARLLPAAEAGERTASVIAILVLQALALEAQGKTAEALGMLARALVLAEPEVFVRVFADEGAPMAALLVKGLQAQQQGRLPAWAGVSPDYARSLVAAIGLPAGPATTPPADHSTVAAEPLVEPLSAREIEVLRLVAAGQSNQEIAQTLILGVTTVKTHLNNIYGKLEVRSRTEAVARARELHLLA